MVLTSHTVSDYPTHTQRDHTDGHSDQPWNRLPMEPTISNRYIQLPSTALLSARKLKLSKRPETRLRASIYTTNQYKITHSALHELWSDWEPPSLQRQFDPLSRIKILTTKMKLAVIVLLASLSLFSLCSSLDDDYQEPVGWGCLLKRWAYLHACSTIRCAFINFVEILFF